MAVLPAGKWCLLGPRARRGDDATEEQPPAIKDSIGATKHPQTIRTSSPRVSHLSDTDRCETKLTRLGGGLFDPTTRDKTAPATCVLEDTPIDRTYQPQCRLKKEPPPPESNTLAPESNDERGSDEVL